MPYAPVDINSLNLDQVPQGFVPVDLSSVQLDQSANSPPAQKGFFDRVSDDWQKRDTALNQASDMAGENKFVGGDAGLVYNAMGQTLQKGLSDVPKEAIASLPQPVKDAGNFVYSSVASDPIVGGPVRGAGWLLDQAGQGYNKFKQNNPTAGLYLDSTLGFGNALAAGLPIKGESIPSQAVGTATDAAQNLSGKLGNSLVNTAGDIKDSLAPAVPTSEAAFQQAGKAYQELKNSQTALTPQGVQKFVSAARQAADIDPQRLLVSGDSKAYSLVNGLQNLADSGQPVSIQTLHGIVKDISQAANNHFTTGLDETGRDLLNVKDAVLDAAQNPEPGDLTGGDGGFDAWQRANNAYSQGSKMSDVENVIQRAKGKANPSGSLRTGFSNLLNNAKKTRGYTDEQISALEAAAKTGTVTDVLSTFGGRIIPALSAIAGETIGGPAGAIVGGAAGYTGAAASRNLATSMQMRRANALLRSLGPSSAPKVAQVAEASPAIEAMKMLPKPETPYVSNAAGQSRPMTMQEMEAGNNARAYAQNMGLTPDITSNINKLNIREKVGPAWDQINATQQNQIKSDISKAYGDKIPLEQALMEAKNRASQLAAETQGQIQPGSLAEALLNAKRMK